MNTDDTAILIVKISGSIVEDDAAMEAFWRSVVELHETARIVVVHGGGRQMTAMAKRLGHAPRIVQGRRVTTDLDLDILQWAVCGRLNTQLVAQATAQGLGAVGLTGADAKLLQVAKRPPWRVNGETVDFGWVGDVERVNASVLTALLDAGLMPVVAPLGIDAEGQVFNVNADTVAQAVAGALHATELLFVTRTGGVRRHADVPDSHLRTCDRETFETGVKNGWVAGGMRVKLETALAAVAGGVERAVICGAGDLVSRQHATRVIG